jgi:two-component system sensor kinase FixL
MTENPSSERALDISTRSADHSVCVLVSDRGTGISCDSLESVFDPFVTTKEQGLGLGLSICRSIVTAHGGRIWATRNPDRGTTVHLSLPAAKTSVGFQTYR